MTSRADQVTELIGKEICAGILAPGTSITAEALQTRTQTSRSAVREGLRVLVSLGLLKVRRRIGYEICGHDNWALLSPEVMRWRLAGPNSAHVLEELLALRTLLEPASAGQAADAADGDARTAIAQAAGDLWAAAAGGEREAFIEADRRFHQNLLIGSGNPLISALGDLLAESLPPRAPDAESISLEEARAHLELADAIARADAAAARSLAAAILQRSA